MIITEEILINNRLIKSSDLSKFSHVKLDVMCDVCGIIKNIAKYRHSKSCDKNDGKYYCNNCKWIKYEKTCIDKYGCKNASSNDDIKERRKDSVKMKHGVENVFQHDIVKIKIKKTCIDKYVDNPSKCQSVKNKILNTFNNKYGIDHPMKNEKFLIDFMKRSLKIKNFNNSDIYYQGTYELDFLEKYSSAESIENGKVIKYIFGNNTHSYLSDFYLPKYNLIIEIKSKYTYNLHLDKNLSKKEYSILSGHNHIFIIDKDYTEFEKIINNNEKI